MGRTLTVEVGVVKNLLDGFKIVRHHCKQTLAKVVVIGHAGLGKQGGAGHCQQNRFGQGPLKRMLAEDIVANSKYHCHKLNKTK